MYRYGLRRDKEAIVKGLSKYTEEAFDCMYELGFLKKPSK